ncbi:MAG: hypothetical protein WCC04_04970 [Terriglobales bacterium]
MRELRIAALVVGAVVVLYLLIAFIPHWAIVEMRGDSEPPLTYRLVLPDGYVGWVRVDFGVDSAPKVFKADKSHEVAEIRVGEDGRARTSDLEVYLSPRTEYEFFYDVKGSLLPVDEELVSHEMEAGGVGARADDYDQPLKPYSWYFFVGPESYRARHPNDEFLRSGAPLPTPGRISSDMR